MNISFFHAKATVVYAFFLVLIYNTEISVTWRYWGFEPYESLGAVGLAMILAILVSLFIPNTMETRGMSLSVVHYAFFVPSILSLASNGFDYNYLVAIAISISLILIVSRIQLHAFSAPSISLKSFLAVNLGAFAVVVLLIVGFGGLRTFDLNIFSVYEFRRQAAAGLPGIFAYVFSATAKVIAPFTMILAIKYRSALLVITALALTIALFGMTHHKSVLFFPVFSGVLFLVLQSRRSMVLIKRGFIIVAAVSVTEISYLHFSNSDSLPMFTGVLVRRSFFVPPMIDFHYIEYFLDRPKFLWSTSRLSLGLTDNPYDMASALLVGEDVFSKEGTAANTGIVGSGFSQAGFFGVVLYAALFGLLVSFLQAYGRVLGHNLTTAASIVLLVTIVTSSDFSTVVLSHGLVLLFLLLLLFPRPRAPKNETETSFL